jgi:hypothetical protein
MSVLLQLGVVDVTSGLMLCAATSAFGVVLFVRASRVLGAPHAASAPSPAGGAVPAAPASVVRPTA